MYDTAFNIGQKVATCLGQDLGWARSIATGLILLLGVIFLHDFLFAVRCMNSLGVILCAGHTNSCAA